MSRGSGKQESQKEATGADDVGGIQRSMPSFIILHYSPFKAVWDSAMQILILYTALVTPYMTTFHLYEEKSRMLADQNANTRKQPDELLTAACPSVIVDIFVDIVFVMDIVITFRTTFMHSGEIVSDPRLIAINYIKSWFLLDALAAIPFDLLLFGNGTGTSESMMFSRLLKLTRLIRLLRFFTSSSRFSQYGAAVLLFLMSMYALIAHWLACAFYAIAAYEREELQQRTGWIDLLAEKLQIPVTPNDSSTISLDTESKYITSLYFTFTLLASIGFGNVAPNTDAEKIFSIFGMLIGSLLSAAIFGNVSSIMLRVYQGTEEFQEHQTSIKEFIRFHRVPGYLAKRLLEYWQYTWSQTNGIDMSAVLTTFPQCLQADICLHLNGMLLTKFPAFQKANQGCLRMLCMRFKTVHIPPNNFLIHRGEQLSAIYFIARGCVEILSDDDIIAILGKDDTFGDKQFLSQLERQLVAAGKHSQESQQSPRIPQSHSEYYVRALTSCDCNKIDLVDFLEILRLYPEFVRHFRRDFILSFNLKSGSYVPRGLDELDQDVLHFIHIKMPKLQTRHRTRTNSARSQTMPRFKMQEVSFGFGDASTYDADMTDFQVYCGDECGAEKESEAKVIDDFQPFACEKPEREDTLLFDVLRVEPPSEFASMCNEGQFVTLDEFMTDAYRKVDKLVDNFEQFERKIVADTQEMLRLVSLLAK